MFILGGIVLLAIAIGLSKRCPPPPPPTFPRWGEPPN